MSDAESFETTLLVLRLQCRGDRYLTELCDVLEAAHEREMEELRRTCVREEGR